MKIISFTAALVAIALLSSVGQEAVIQDVKHGAKKAGETLKDGFETVGEKTKETANTTHRESSRTSGMAKQKPLSRTR